MRNVRDTPARSSLFGDADTRRRGARLRPSYQDALSWPVSLEAFVEPRFVDRSAHMSTSFYAHLFDRAGRAFLESFALDRHSLDQANAAMVALEQHLHHHAELREWDPLEVHTRLTGVDPRGLRFLHFMVDPARQRVVATAEVTCACVDRGTRRAMLLPPELLDRLQAEMMSTFAEDPADASGRS